MNHRFRDVRMLIEYVLKQDQNVIAELLTTNQYFVAHPGDNEYAREAYESMLAEVTSPNYVESQANERREALKRNLDPNLKLEQREAQIKRARDQAEFKVMRFTRAKGRFSRRR